MRLFVSSLGLVALFSMAVACVGPRPDDDSEDEEVRAAPSAQIDVYKSYTIKQSGVLVASAYAGFDATGLPVEYWAAKPTYSASAARTYEAASQSCAGWKRSVCGTSWSGATYYKAQFTQQTLDCGLPPGPCQPAPGGVSFLGGGTYTTTNVDATTFAWTYVNNGCEEWAMHHTISGYSSQAAPVFGFASHSSFINAVCAMNPVPSTYFDASYVALANGCSSIVCE